MMQLPGIARPAGREVARHRLVGAKLRRICVTDLRGDAGTMRALVEQVIAGSGAGRAIAEALRERRVDRPGDADMARGGRPGW